MKSRLLFEAWSYGMILWVLDIGSTLVALPLGASEQNPMLRVLGSFPALAVASLFMSTFPLMFCAWWWMQTFHNERMFRAGYMVAGIPRLFVIISNFVVLVHLLGNL